MSEAEMMANLKANKDALIATAAGLTGAVAMRVRSSRYG